MPSSLPNLDFPPFDSSSSYQMSSQERTANQRFNSYTQPATVAQSGQSTVSKRKSTVSKRKPRLPTPAAAAATGKIVYKNKNCSEMKNPHEEYGVFDPSRILHEDPTLPTHHSGGTETIYIRRQFWFFILSLLMDPSKKAAIAWTGRGREFVITSLPTVVSIWSNEQGLVNALKPDSILRNLRACYKRRIMRPIATKSFAFQTEPSIHVGMTRDELSNFIDHSLNSNARFPSTENVMVDSFYPTPPSSVHHDAFSPSTVSPMMYPEINCFFGSIPGTTEPVPSCAYWNPPTHFSEMPPSFPPFPEFAPSFVGYPYF